MINVTFLDGSVKSINADVIDAAFAGVILLKRWEGKNAKTVIAINSEKFQFAEAIEPQPVASPSPAVMPEPSEEPKGFTNV